MEFYPIDHILADIKEAIRKNDAVVLQAPPGSGKTTRVPLALLDIIPPEGRILVLEPRRIAAVSAARWMAKTLGENIGQTMGYSIRFDSRVSKHTRIEVVTEGILTRRILADPTMEGVSMVIFDEFHERSLDADLALALCLDIRRGFREDLKIMIMSATLDCGPIASLLGGAPIVSSGGKIFHVEDRYGVDRRGKMLAEQVTETVQIALRDTTGDILVFLPGAGEIRRVAESLGGLAEAKRRGVSIHPLYGDLPFAEQERALQPSRERKIVLATNIAETSLTIEGIRVVIDSGLTRRLRHDPATGMNRLVTLPVSRASAEQRKGRAGRLGPGVCYRLYSRPVFESLIPYAAPDILVSDLTSLALELAVWGIQDPLALSWLNPPPFPAWTGAQRLLRELGALDAKNAVTQVGRAMAHFPLHPRLGNLLLSAMEIGQIDLGADLAALLSERDILRRADSMPINSAEEADVSDRCRILQLWRQEKKAPPGADPWGLRSVDRVAQQLRRLVASKNKKAAREDVDMVPWLLLAAYPDRIAQNRHEGRGRFLLSQGRGVRMSAHNSMAGVEFIIAAHVDTGEMNEGTVYLAEPVTEDLIREAMGRQIIRQRRIDWDKRSGRIISALEERLDALLLSSKPLNPDDAEVTPLICAAIRSADATLSFSKRARQLQGRVALIRRTFPEENWPDLSDEALLAAPEFWLSPFLAGIRTQEQLTALDLFQPLLAAHSWEQQRFLDQRAPTALPVPSGHHAIIDYASGEIPVLAVKLQEMFGLADTPVIAGGRVKVLLHLLSPARRPVQITQDLQGFWNHGYEQVKKELKGRYPKHPWPDDPWSAAPTSRAKPRSR